MSSLQIRVCGRFRIDEKLYEGKHSSIYLGKNVQSGTDCVIKSQLKSVNYSAVLNEGRVLENIQGGVGIPNLLWFGQNGDFNFLVTELLGNSLQEYLQICGGNFSLKTVLMLADKILSSIEFVHYKNHIHRDIKPQNFVVGLGRKLNQVYTIDFAFSTSYIDPNTKMHRPDIINENKFVGTLRFASLNVLQGHRNSRRDDLESIGYMMLYFLKGNLPWSHAQGQNVKEKRNQIRKIMENTTMDQLCDGIPSEIRQFIEYCRALKYQENPDYNYLKRLLKEKFVKEGFQYDNVFDWILIPLRLKDTELSNRIPLNRFTKKQNQSFSMYNTLDYDFQSQVFVQQKIVDKKKGNQLTTSQSSNQGSNQKQVLPNQQAIKHSDKNIPKNTKNPKNPDDCTIY